MKKNDKQSSAIYRALLSWMLQTIDDKELGNCNYDILQNKYNSIINYCKGKKFGTLLKGFLSGRLVINKQWK
jgi:hypothetical protein